MTGSARRSRPFRFFITSQRTLKPQKGLWNLWPSYSRTPSSTNGVDSVTRGARLHNGVSPVHGSYIARPSHKGQRPSYRWPRLTWWYIGNRAVWSL